MSVIPFPSRHRSFDDNAPEWHAELATNAPRIPWDEFVENWRWEQGEHVGLIGTTGSGKTTLMTEILRKRQYVVVFATKPKDTSMDNLINTQGYKRIAKWSREMNATKYPRRVLWPDARKLRARATQRQVFEDALENIYIDGGWCVAFDEGKFIVQTLKLGPDVKVFLEQGRALNLSLVFSTQRPSWVPVEVFDQSTHLFFWRENDERNVRVIGGIGYRSAATIRRIVSNLDSEGKQFLYVNTRTGVMYRSRTPNPNIEQDEEVNTA